MMQLPEYNNHTISISAELHSVTIRYFWCFSRKDFYYLLL